MQARILAAPPQWRRRGNEPANFTKAIKRHEAQGEKVRDRFRKGSGAKGPAPWPDRGCLGHVGGPHRVRGFPHGVNGDKI